MTDVPGILPQELAKATIVKILESFDEHPIRTVEGFRNAALDGLFAFSPMLDIKEGSFVNVVIETVQRTIREGRMIDFGYLPNDLLKETSTKTREVFEAGELQHPYEEWIGVSSWEGGMCGYFVSPPNPVRKTEGIVVFEIYGIAVPGLPLAVVVNDLCAINLTGGETTIQCGPMIAPDFNRNPELEKRGANMLDPLVTMLRLLADATVPVFDVPAPVKLNKQRALKGKAPIPAHTKVETRDYVSLFAAHKEAGQKGGGPKGHHASPVPHWRRSHQRHLTSGKVVPVRSTKVNWRDTEELHRLFSRVRTP